MAKRTVAQRKAAINVLTAKFQSTCGVCEHKISIGSKIGRLDRSYVHLSCHPDWRPSSKGPLAP